LVHKIGKKLIVGSGVPEYKGSLKQLLKDKIAIKTILRWDDDDQIEVEGKEFGESFTVGYIKHILGYD
jgi:hypothetical protein